MLEGVIGVFIRYPIGSKQVGNAARHMALYAPLEVAKLFLNPRNLGSPWHSVHFLAVRFRAFSLWSLNRFPSSFSSSHDVLTYWEVNSS